MARKIAITWCLLIVSVILAAGCAKKKPPVPVSVAPKGNVVWTEKTTARPGESFSLKVYLTNIDTLAGVQVPIFFHSDSIKLICDSVSFVGGRCETFMFHDVKIPLTCPECNTKYDTYDNPPKQPGICDKDGTKLVQKDQVVFFMAINSIDPKKDIQPIIPGNGLVATVYFTVPQGTPRGIIKLTRGIIPNPSVSLVFSVWNPAGDDLNGQFKEGEIEIQ